MFERPTKGDIDRALSTLMHDARHRCTALMLPAKQLSAGSSTPRVKTVNVALGMSHLSKSCCPISSSIFCGPIGRSIAGCFLQPTRSAISRRGSWRGCTGRRPKSPSRQECHGAHAVALLCHSPIGTGVEIRVVQDLPHSLLVSGPDGGRSTPNARPFTICRHHLSGPSRLRSPVNFAEYDV
jgi:hypothetical protein